MLLGRQGRPSGLPDLCFFLFALSILGKILGIHGPLIANLDHSLALRYNGIMTKMDVKAGSRYRAAAKGVKGGYRYVVVRQVRRAGSHDPYVLVCETSQDGQLLKGRDKDGLKREAFVVSLTCDGGSGWCMPNGYQVIP